MKKIVLFFISFVLLTLSANAWFWNKKGEVLLYLTPYNPTQKIANEEKLETHDIFKLGQRIYFLIYTQDGFKSDYIKYQIIKQDDKAHVGGFSRIRNITKRIKHKHYYIDYFTLSEPGKYAIQIFDIENLHHWISYAHFLVVNE